jgi:hypothetical protein
VTLEKGKSHKHTIALAFSSNEAGTFECHLENKEFSPCKTPMTIRHLKNGKHVFTVRAVDLNGNRSSQTSYGWNVKPGGHYARVAAG